MPIELRPILSDGEIKEPAYIVSDLIYQGQMLAIAGEAGVGKSFLSYNMAMCIAGGLAFLNLPTATGPVLYFDEENSFPDLRAYLQRVWRGLAHPDIAKLEENLVIEHFAIPQAMQDERLAWIKIRAVQVKPILLIIDTATPICAIKDENSNAEATHVIKELRLVHAAAGPQAAILIIKHAKIDHQDNDRITMRGAKAWDGALDGTLFHMNSPGQPSKTGLRNTILRPGKRRAYGLKEPIKIGALWTEDGGIKLEVKNVK